MKSTPLTQGMALLILALYVLYGLFALPFAGLLLSLAVGLIAFGGLESFELSVATAILVGVFYSLVLRSGMLRQAESVRGKTKEGFNSDGAAVISARVNRIYKERTSGPAGVYASPFVEGFADASAEAEAESKVTNGGDKAKASTPATTDGSSKPADANSSGGAGSGITPPAPPAAASAVKGAMTEAVAGFKGDSGDDGLFKLGVLPEEKKGGYHIDQGTTVLNALNALKPDQIANMTKDTQSLIETQKSLMGMLSSMKPMLQDGKQMMETFQQMFGTSGGGMAALKL